MEVYGLEMVYGLNVRNASNRKTLTMTTKQSFFYAAILGASLCHAQSNVVYYDVNSNALDVVFEDTNLSVSNQTLIVADLNLCLKEWGKKAILYFRDKGDSIGYLYIPQRFFVFHFVPDKIVATPNGHALQIPQVLSNTYTNRFAFAAAHSNQVAAAYEFVTFVSSPAFLNIPAQDLPHYYLSKTASDAEIIARAQDIISEYASYAYFPPSIFCFDYAKVGPGPATTNLLMTIPSRTEHERWIYTPVIWHDERWKFLSMKWLTE